jgi:tetratricopeptide (TPR) repeat protein
MALHVLSRYEEAVEHYELARRLYREAGREVDMARVERAMVDALIYLGRYDEALELAGAARQVFERQDEKRYQAHELLGDLFLAEGEIQRAHEQYVEAVSFIEQIRCQIRVDEFRSAFFRDKLRVYEKLIRLCLDQEDPARQAEAFYSAYPENRWALWSGTSFSTALVTGEAALLLQLNPKLNRTAMNTVITNSGVSIDSLNPAYARKLGRVRIDYLDAVNRILSGNRSR